MEKKYIIIGVTVLAAAYYTYSGMIQPKKYMAENTFMVSDDEGGGGISSILAQFGFWGFWWQ